MLDSPRTDVMQQRGAIAAELAGTGHVLLTGITGSVGSEIVRWLHARAPGCRLSALLRASSDLDLERRWDDVLSSADLDIHERAAVKSRWKPMRGDITEPDLGIDRHTVAALRNDVTHFIHAAADVRFTAPLDESRRTNALGTRHALDLGARCKRLEQFAHVSTCFVAGRRSGRILEDELEHDEGFASAYEQTKYEAEIDARSFMRDMPLSIYRLGLLPGRGRDGYVHQFGAFHRLLYYYDKGVLEMLPGEPHHLIDVAPTEWAADVLMQLFVEHFEAGRTYHVCSGDEAVRIESFVELTNETFREHRGGRAALAPLQLVDSSVYERFVERLVAMRTESTDRMVGVMRTMAPHAMLGKVFDRSATLTCLGSAARAPDFRDYYARIVRYCIGSDWGRAEKTAASPA